MTPELAPLSPNYHTTPTTVVEFNKCRSSLKILQYINWKYGKELAVTETTGEDLTNAILGELEKDCLDIQNCSGQEYDNGTNMLKVGFFWDRITAFLCTCAPLKYCEVFSLVITPASFDTVREAPTSPKSRIYTRAFGNGPRNSEPWSSDVDDT
ncbi:hypothetical protein TNCV_4682231 [Trichonephila clavipes]|nr:hypothetical protein TNCV_4682231 [Trichonephila clavipes]